MLKKVFIWIFGSIVLITVSTLTWVDRIPYTSKPFYEKMSARMDALSSNFPDQSDRDSLFIGWSKVNISVTEGPLAGYGNRNPKEMEGIHDSVFVRTVTFTSGLVKTAIVSVDMLIIHPEVTRRLKMELASIGWNINQVFLTATHTHSSIGGWAPGLLGMAIAGKYDERVVDGIADKIVTSIKLAEENQREGSFGFGEMTVQHLIRNRLVGEKGIVDPMLKLLTLTSGDEHGVQAMYGAHATCLGGKNRQLTGDYPAMFTAQLMLDSTLQYAGYSAGAVASMGPNTAGNRSWDGASYMGTQLHEQVQLIRQLGIPESNQAAIRSIRIPLELRAPAVKISANIALRPWVFHWLVGGYRVDIQLLQLNNTLLIGLPCDFSGEIATELYQYARERGLNLIITSFNGGYIGYIPHDQWYDLAKYEPRSMSWYGFDNGAYFTELIKKLIDMSQS